MSISAFLVIDPYDWIVPKRVKKQIQREEIICIDLNTMSIYLFKGEKATKF